VTTYYGVWSGKEWWGGAGVSGLFRTTEIAVANAQALAANSAVRVNQYSGGHWEARTIGEDGLPAKEHRRPRFIVCYPEDLEAARAVLDATEKEGL